MMFAAVSFFRSFRLGIQATAALVIASAGPAAAQSVEYTPYQPPEALPAPIPVEPLTVAATPAPPPMRRWYGYQLMLSDAALCTLAYKFAAPEIGLGLWVGPPIIHGVHHNKTMAIVSPVMRTLIPLLGGSIGAAATQCHHEENDFLDLCPLGGIIAGALVGMAVAAVTDYALAWEVEAPATPAPPARSGVTLSVPAVAPITNGAALVMGGAF
jgi:hypothetical protein